MKKGLIIRRVRPAPNAHSGQAGIVGHRNAFSRANGWRVSQRKDESYPLVSCYSLHSTHWRPWMLIEQEIAARRERAQGAVARILARPDADVYGDYQVRSSSNKTYRVALRGPGLFENYCSCPDFAVNTLGTCKHIEALLLRLGRRHGKAFEQGKFSRARASLSLHYGETLGVRLRLPSSPSPALQALAREYFDESGLLKSERLRDVEKLMDELYGLRQIMG